MKHIKLYEEFVNEQEEILNEDSSLALIVILQAAIVQGLLIGQIASNGGGDGFHPIDDLKAWWAKRKKDKAVKSIVDKLKEDPEVLAFLKMSNWAQRGKWYKLIEPKLNDEEKKYLRSISRTPFMNEEVPTFESFVNEAERIPTMLFISDLRKYFSDIHYDTVKRQYDRDTAPEIAQADNGKWYQVSSTYNRWDERVIKLKSVKAPK
jgi:hypothetical protein